MRGFVHRRRAISARLAGCALIAALAVGADSPTGGVPGTYAFVLSNIYLASDNDPQACPVMTESSTDVYRKTLSPEEQEKWKSPDKRRDLLRLMYQRFGFKELWINQTSIENEDDVGFEGIAKRPPHVTADTLLTPETAAEVGALNGFPTGRGRPAWRRKMATYTSCSYPEDFPQLAHGLHTYAGAFAPGIDLDGKQSKNDFQDQGGKRGVDNELWRVLGCVKTYREIARPEIAKKIIMSSQRPTLIELRGVDNLENDDDVEVRFYASTTTLLRDGRGEALGGATFKPAADPAFRAVAKGRIENSVLITEPTDVQLAYFESILDAPRFIRGARIVAKINGGQTLEGAINGYYDITSAYDSIEQLTQRGADNNGMSCPAVKKALGQYADGYRDAKTGKYTAISSSLGISGTRAFVARTTNASARLDR